ncbi:hypothetical protein HS041_19460 [Planomonospora sp. ID67723]|uniref:hypothetical protein n=1 Tax=Planomonospora sp. ID67723 TaxID=2738134 RepID=UPI0018C420F3|nr:hypothetical protein [Planomonospora sp. ID67723]MBG0829949.1 hypothetical protein [Planomonospora sp. ID67723]
MSTSASTGPPRDAAGPRTSSWRQQALAVIAELQTQLDRLGDGSALAVGAQRHLDVARQAAAEQHGLLSALTGAAVDRTWANIHQAEATLLRLTPDAELPWWSADVLARAAQHLGPGDPRRARLEARLRKTDGRLVPEDRALAVSTLQAANVSAQIEKCSLRSFRNIVLASALIMAAIAVVLAVVGFLQPNKLRLCFHDPSTGPACPIRSSPDRWDVAIVELVGLAAAALTGAAGLRHIRGTATPYTLPMTLALLKLPAGAVSAVLGLLLVQGGFVPGLSNLDTSAQIIAWAVVFGAAQQLVTRLVDAQGQVVLRNVRDSSRAVDKRPEPTS